MTLNSVRIFSRVIFLLGILLCIIPRYKLNLSYLAINYIMKFRQIDDPDVTAARHPEARKVHHTELWSIGPNDEWCIDGHENSLS